MGCKTLKFKVGDKVVISNLPKWYGGMIKLNDKCVVTKISRSEDMMWIRNADDRYAPIYKSWAIIPKLKNQQLLFAFMYVE